MKAPVKPRVDHLPCVLSPCSTAYGARSFSHWCPVMMPGTRYDLTHGSLIFAEGLCAQNSKEGSRGHGVVASGCGLLCGLTWTLLIALPLGPHNPDELSQIPGGADAGVVGAAPRFDPVVVSA
jgi:hypothetical protein